MPLIIGYVEQHALNKFTLRLVQKNIRKTTRKKIGHLEYMIVFNVLAIVIILIGLTFSCYVVARVGVAHFS
jgi:hypothetical protein